MRVEEVGGFFCVHSLTPRSTVVNHLIGVQNSPELRQAHASVEGEAVTLPLAAVVRLPGFTRFHVIFRG